VTQADRRHPPHPDLPVAAWDDVQTALDGVAQRAAVKVLWAIESGSRAWGFPSPDSDLDCRFIYIRTLPSYLALQQSRDVIELPLVGDLDVNGWDLSKALKLLLKGNAVVIEWLQSPIVYRGDTGFADAFFDLADQIVERSLVAKHYRGLAKRQWLRARVEGSFKLKRVFYMLRPTMALRWLRLNGSSTIPPMRLQHLMAECDLPRSLYNSIADLIALKAQTREMGVGPVPEAIEHFIADEEALADTVCDEECRKPFEERSAFAEAFWQEQLASRSPSSVAG
jgi:uncharacterized protein